MKAEHVEVSRGRRLCRQPGKTPDFYPTNQNCACEVYQKCFAQASSSRRLPELFYSDAPSFSVTFLAIRRLLLTAHIIFLKPFILSSLFGTHNGGSSVSRGGSGKFPKYLGGFW